MATTKVCGLVLIAQGGTLMVAGYPLHGVRILQFTHTKDCLYMAVRSLILTNPQTWVEIGFKDQLCQTVRYGSGTALQTNGA